MISMELKPEWGRKMPQTPKPVQKEISDQMTAAADWREAHHEDPLVGKTQAEAEEAVLGETFRVKEFMDKQNALSYGLPNAEELTRIGLRILPEQSVKSLLSAAREYLQAAKFGNEDVMLKELQKLRDIESSITPDLLKKYPGLGTELNEAIRELTQAADKMRKPIAARKRAA